MAQHQQLLEALRSCPRPAPGLSAALQGPAPGRAELGAAPGLRSWAQWGLLECSESQAGSDPGRPSRERGGAAAELPGALQCRRTQHTGLHDHGGGSRAPSDRPAAAPSGERQGMVGRGTSGLGRLPATVRLFSGAQQSLGTTPRPVLRGRGFRWVHVTVRARDARGVWPREN